jgi:hypothetical protein
MHRLALSGFVVAVGLGLSGCAYWHPTGKPASGISSSAPDAVQSAAGGATGGGANAFTKEQISPGSPAGANQGR